MESLNALTLNARLDDKKRLLEDGINVLEKEKNNLISRLYRLQDYADDALKKMEISFHDSLKKNQNLINNLSNIVEYYLENHMKRIQYEKECSIRKYLISKINATKETMEKTRGSLDTELEDLSQIKIILKEEGNPRFYKEYAQRINPSLDGISHEEFRIHIERNSKNQENNIIKRAYERLLDMLTEKNEFKDIIEVVELIINNTMNFRHQLGRDIKNISKTLDSENFNLQKKERHFQNRENECKKFENIVSKERTHLQERIDSHYQKMHYMIDKKNKKIQDIDRKRAKIPDEVESIGNKLVSKKRDRDVLEAQMDSLSPRASQSLINAHQKQHEELSNYITKLLNKLSDLVRKQKSLENKKLIKEEEIKDIEANEGRNIDSLEKIQRHFIDNLERADETIDHFENEVSEIGDKFND